VNPLIRNKNGELTFRRMNIKTRLTKTKVNYKAGAFADDVDVVCKSDQTSEEQVFEKYDKFTCRSESEFSRCLNYNVSDNGQIFAISTVK
jgi:hypothetical protein